MTYDTAPQIRGERGVTSSTERFRKTGTAPNEVLCKVLAYNLSLRVREMFVHDIVPEFWPDCATEAVAALP